MNQIYDVDGVIMSRLYVYKKRSSVSSVNDENHYSNGDSVGQSVMTVAIYVYTLSALAHIIYVIIIYNS